jgi:hypothetical protein
VCVDHSLLSGANVRNESSRMPPWHFTCFISKNNLCILKLPYELRPATQMSTVSEIPIIILGAILMKISSISNRTALREPEFVFHRARAR